MQILKIVYISSLILGKNTDKNVIIFPPKVGQLFNSLSLILNYSLRANSLFFIVSHSVSTETLKNSMLSFNKRTLKMLKVLIVFPDLALDQRCTSSDVYPQFHNALEQIQKLALYSY